MGNQNSKGQIDSNKAVLRELFTKCWFSIPSYQRAYVWGSDEISELIDDVTLASHNAPSGQYFLGSMVLQKYSETFSFLDEKVPFDVFDVLDGQQRLTTLFLLFAVLRDITKSVDLRKSLPTLIFQEESEAMRTPGRTRLVYRIRQEIQEFIDEFVKQDGGTGRIEDLYAKVEASNLSLANMARAVLFMRDRMKAVDVDELTRFAIYLMNNVLVIYVASEDLDDAFRLFTILNDRGIPLSNSDILKATNLGVITDVAENSKWAFFWEETEGELGREDFDRFLSFIRTIFVKDKARESLLKEFQDRIYAPNLMKQGVDTFKTIRRYKTAYDEAILLNPAPLNAANEYMNLIAILQASLPSTDWIPAVLFWYDKFGNRELLPFLRALDNKFSADWIMQLTPTQRGQNVGEILKRIETAKSPSDVLSCADVFSYKKPELIQLLKEDVYGKRFARYILLRLEWLYQDHSSLMSSFGHLTIEHVLPQNPNADGGWTRMFNEEARRSWTHKLGNLVLLSRRKNASLGNLEFIEKKEKYFSDNISAFPNSLRVMQFQKFTPDVIVTRQDELINRLANSY